MNGSRPSAFEQSFMFHMIRDFFLLLLLVAAVELGIRYAALRWDFARQEPQRVDRAAQQLANDIRSIMLNSGGPTAAQTVYPILNRAFDDLGLAIAVEPSAVTVESMKSSRNMDVQGLRAQWPGGDHQQAQVSLRAEQFCLGCHVKAQVGDVLGTVSVRSYLQRKEAVWWQEVRLTAGALSLKILAHTVVLFLLLKVRMAPLLALQSTVAGLAKGVMNLAPRAAVNTEDEFGELARDLNHFLDRITQLVADLDRILGEVLSVGGRLGQLNRQLEQQLDGLRDAALAQANAWAQRDRSAQWTVAHEAGAFSALRLTLHSLAEAGTLAEPQAGLLREHLGRLQHSFDALTQAVPAAAPQPGNGEGEGGADLAPQYQGFGRSLREMAVLEATMQAVAESGQQLLRRLSPPKA